MSEICRVFDSTVRGRATGGEMPPERAAQGPGGIRGGRAAPLRCSYILYADKKETVGLFSKRTVTNCLLDKGCQAPRRGGKNRRISRRAQAGASDHNRFGAFTKRTEQFHSFDYAGEWRN